MAYLGKSVERDMYFGAKPELFRLAETMRKNSTEAENILWKSLKKFRIKGYIFRRQHPIDIFIADFYCHKIKLVIEVDGEVHDNIQAQEYDDGRSGEIERYGIKVIRFKNEEIINNQELIIQKIRSIITEISSPSLLGEGDRKG
ncbi:MAG: endonuclease domain-containing protein [Bacteroidia bacterium]|nr:endonuclease domain-containing protein [Bacteroidia bacterium]